MPPPIRPTSQPPSYAEATSQQAYSHEPDFIILTPVRREGSEGTDRKNPPPVHDISAGDRLVALADINIRKAFKALIKPSSDKKSTLKEISEAEENAESSS